MRANKSCFFLDISPYTHTTFSCWCLVFLCRRDTHEFMVFHFPSSLPGGSLFGAHFGGVGVGILLESCDSSSSDYDDDGVDTSSLVCIRFSPIST
jgi:hypothetical protein